MLPYYLIPMDRSPQVDFEIVAHCDCNALNHTAPDVMERSLKPFCYDEGTATLRFDVRCTEDELDRVITEKTDAWLKGTGWEVMHWEVESASQYDRADDIADRYEDDERWQPREDF